MSAPLYARDVDTGQMKELEAELVGGKYALLTVGSTGSTTTGTAGVVVTTNTTAVTGTFTAIQMLAETTFSTFTETGATGQAMTGFAIPAGVVLFGNFTGYTLTSGKVRAYV